MLRTPFYKEQVALGAKMGAFADWHMALHYTQGPIEEHRAVRKGAGLFDVSHMGVVEFTGDRVLEALEFLATNDCAGSSSCRVIYSPFCAEDGGTLDDCLIYLHDPHRAWVVVNAVNREKMRLHFMEHACFFDVQVKLLEEMAILALQGPRSSDYLSTLLLKKNHWCSLGGVLVSATGYTGERGFELYGTYAQLKPWWEQFLAQGVVPCGLIARDSLRLEMGYALYGHELSPSILASESVSAWAVKCKKSDFLGKKSLSMPARRWPIALQGPRGPIARQGAEILHEKGAPLGVVTSGGYSPSLDCIIALGQVSQPVALGSTVAVIVRGVSCPMIVVTLPFKK